MKKLHTHCRDSVWGNRMTSEPQFMHSLNIRGQETTMSLAEVLDVSANNDISSALKEGLEEIRAAEFRAERDTAEVRLY